MKRAIFPGSFDPFTIGHYDIVNRGLKLFDEIVIGIGRNSTKKETFPIREREEAIRKIFKDEPRVTVQIYDCLTVDFAREVDAQFILRGVRCVQDFEYERNMAEANKDLGGIETILLYTRPEYAHISSTLVRDLYAYNKDVSAYVPNHLR
jgi:pantetheine-phosphate adenylyltransferase